MPILTRKKMVAVRAGLVCDCCGKRDDEGFNDFAVEHTCGYDSSLDQGTVSFALCDDCLLRLALAHIPGAVIRSEGALVDRAALHTRLVARAGAAREE